MTLKGVERSGCKECPFKAHRTVGSRGNANARLMLVGESPGVSELRKGIPFVDDAPSGSVLWQTLKPLGIEPDDVFTTNALACHPPGKKDQSKLAQGCRACNSRLLNEVDLAPRDVILALGNAAMWALTNNYNLKITQDRGKLIPSDFARHGIIPVLHPAALLRGTGSYRQFREDLTYAVELVNGGEPKVPIEPTICIHTNAEDVRAISDVLVKFPYISADLETTGLNRRTNSILALGVAVKPEEVHVIPPSLIEHARKLLEHPHPRWIWHSGKFDAGFLHEVGLPCKVDEDTLLLSYALDENPGIHDLESCASDVLGAPDYKYLTDPYKEKDGSFSNMPFDLLCKYRLAPDVSYTLQLFHKLRARVKANKHLEKLYTKTLIPASELLEWVESNGIHINQKQVAVVKEKLTAEVNSGELKLQELAGYAINPRSPAQIAKLLYDELHLPKRHGRSTGKDVLKKLPKHAVVVALQDYRIKHKRLSTYITGKKQGVEANLEADGRVHTTYLIHGTPTGRLASRAPNLQNIPREASIRNIFVAAPGYILLEPDLNQAEIRSLAQLSGDPELLAIYNSTDRSLHNEVAEDLFGPNYTPEEKMRAKAVNFGIMYGREAPSLAEEYDISRAEAQSYIDAWFARFPQAHAFIKRCRAAPRNNQTLITCFGNKKRPGLVTQVNLKDRQNEAANFPHQSIASHINLTAAVRCKPKLIELGVKIINLVHDSILIEARNNPVLIEQVKSIVIPIMEGVAPSMGLTRVPFKVGVKQGFSWGELKEAA